MSGLRDLDAINDERAGVGKVEGRMTRRHCALLGLGLMLILAFLTKQHGDLTAFICALYIVCAMPDSRP